MGRPEGERPLGRPRRRWENNVTVDIQKEGYGGMDWIEQTQDQMAGACECGNETSYFVKCGEFID